MLKAMSPIQSSEDGILTKLFRSVIIETGFINSITYFINRYSGKKSKPTISRLVLAGEITWNSFTFLIITILKAKYMKFSVVIKDGGETHVSSITIKSEEYKEKEAGKHLRVLFKHISDSINIDKDQLRDLIKEYHKRGGKKNKATITKILDSDLISWKAFIFLVFELLVKEEVTLLVDIKGVHGKVTTHELLIKKN